MSLRVVNHLTMSLMCRCVRHKNDTLQNSPTLLYSPKTNRICYEPRKPNSRRKRQSECRFSRSGVAYKERLNMPVVASEVERQQPAHLSEYFNERLAFYRERSKKLPDGKSAPYLKSE